MVLLKRARPRVLGFFETQRRERKKEERVWES